MWYSRYSSPDFTVYDTVAAAAAATIGKTRGVRCEADGTLVVTKPDGSTAAVPFKAGETQSIVITGVVSSGSTGCAPIVVYR